MTATVVPQMTTTMTMASMVEKSKKKKEPMKSPIEDTVERMLRIRWLVCLGALLPGAGCYFVVAYTYVFQFEKVSNFTECKECPNMNITLPPVSYSIGIWSPQKYIWMMIMFIHLPPRLAFLTLYRRLFLISAPKSQWYSRINYIYMLTLWAEPFGLILVSVVDINGGFVLHALGFAIWIICFNFNMLFNILLHHFGGCRDVHDRMETTWRIKCVIFLVGYFCAISTPITYPYFTAHCSPFGRIKVVVLSHPHDFLLAYNLFSLAELIEVGCNSIFYAIAYFEFPKTRITIGIKSVQRNLNELDKMAPALPHKDAV
ncbi:hypothetical protein CRE_02089 [Caenorhabditis remanei]|uniref:CWH43-like N-terminal domain-containing protein n=1 Tax=Caenorhabditis remanei TaxID=31234 RepID=E3LEY9_CAERE|nr:hypothetical protein CRE_02089 [Caenorhabditis remanei]